MSDTEKSVTVGEYIVAMLKRHPGLSMRQASIKAGLNTNAIQQIINSKITPRPNTIKALADMWGTPEDYVAMMRLSGYEVPDTVDIAGLSSVKRHAIDLLSRDTVPDQVAAFIAAGLEQIVRSEGKENNDNAELD